VHNGGLRFGHVCIPTLTSLSLFGYSCDHCKVYDDYYYSKALYENSVETDKWAYKSFNILNQNGEEIVFVCM